ncbi:MAG: CsgG/HfaB family protein [Myxococcota bacterium]
MIALWASIALADSVVAVTQFDANSIDAELRPLGLAVADMLVTDLQASSDLQLVERTRLEVVLDELELSQSSFVDPAQAVRLGRGVGADFVVTGSLTVALEGMRLDARMVEVASGEVKAAVSATGATDAFFELERRVAVGLLKELGTEAQLDARNLTLEQVLLGARRLEEADEAYLERLTAVRAYKQQRWVRKAPDAGGPWGVYDSGGAFVHPREVAAADGSEAALLKVRRGERRLRDVLIVTGVTSVALGGVALAGIGAFEADDPVRSGIGTGAALGSALTLAVGTNLAWPLWFSSRSHKRVWTPAEADAVLNRRNAALATELGLTPADRMQADLQD